MLFGLLFQRLYRVQPFPFYSASSFLCQTSLNSLWLVTAHGAGGSLLGWQEDQRKGKDSSIAYPAINWDNRHACLVLCYWPDFSPKSLQFKTQGSSSILESGRGEALLGYRRDHVLFSNPALDSHHQVLEEASCLRHLPSGLLQCLKPILDLLGTGLGWSPIMQTPDWLM